MLHDLPDDWASFAGGRRWRCRGPAYLCEVEEPGSTPSLLTAPGIADRLRRIRSFYAGRVTLGRLDERGTGLDILVANAMTESFGTVPSPLAVRDLERQLDAHPAIPLDVRLDQLLREMGAVKASRWLVRREPGYRGPVATPSKVSVGAHHMLIATAMALPSQRGDAGAGPDRIRRQVISLAADSLHAAQLAVEYLNGKSSQHFGKLPLIAACYNAGSPRHTTANPWRLVQYGEHIDRWIGYYNASRQLTGNEPVPPSRTETRLPVPRTAGPAGIPSGTSDHTMLSPHFSLAELVASDTARAKGIDNQPPPGVVENLARLAELLELVRDVLGNHPIRINSAYRCPELNRAVGSAGTSMHLHGLAADFVCPQFGSPLRICQAIAASSLAFDQLIHEFGQWVHIGLPKPDRPSRRQQLTIDRAGTHVGLLPV